MPSNLTFFSGTGSAIIAAQRLNGDLRRAFVNGFGAGYSKYDNNVESSKGKCLKWLRYRGRKCGLLLFELDPGMRNAHANTNNDGGRCSKIRREPLFSG